jgi:hypothetical protein
MPSAKLQRFSSPIPDFAAADATISCDYFQQIVTCRAEPLNRQGLAVVFVMSLWLARALTLATMRRANEAAILNSPVNGLPGQELVSMNPLT